MTQKNSSWKRKAYDAFCLASIAIALFAAGFVSVQKVTAAFNGSAEKSTAGKDSSADNEDPSYKASISFTGDLLLETAFYDWMDDHYSFGNYLDKVEPYLKADLTITNLEQPIGGEELGISSSNYNFNAPYEIAAEIAKTPINFVTFANNHTFDKGQQGINNTLSILDENGIGHTGAYASLEDSNEISYVDVNGIKIAILAYTFGTNQPYATDYGVNHYLNLKTYQFSDGYKEDISAQIQEARKNADFVIVAAHWGQEFTYNLSNSQSLFADFLVEQNVDLVIGNHSHNIQPAEVVDNSAGRKTFIFYSMGNFFSAAANVSRASDTFTNMYEIGAIGRIQISKDPETGALTVYKPEVIPVVNHFEDGYTNFQLIPFSEYTEEMAAKHMQALYSDNFNLEFLTQQIQDVLGDSGMLVLDN